MNRPAKWHRCISLLLVLSANVIPIAACDRDDSPVEPKVETKSLELRSQESVRFTADLPDDYGTTSGVTPWTLHYSSPQMVTVVFDQQASGGETLVSVVDADGNTYPLDAATVFVDRPRLLRAVYQSNTTEIIPCCSGLRLGPIFPIKAPSGDNETSTNPHCYGSFYLAPSPDGHELRLYFSFTTKEEKPDWSLASISGHKVIYVADPGRKILGVRGVPNKPWTFDYYDNNHSPDFPVVTPTGGPIQATINGNTNGADLGNQTIDDAWISFEFQADIEIMIR